MRIGTIFIFILGIIITSTGCGKNKTDATNELKLTLEDEKIIQEYCDTKTDDILRVHTSNGKMYSAFEVLGTDKDRIYIWFTKQEYSKNIEQNTPKSLYATTLPAVLYVKSDNAGISITGHECPPDGVDYAKAIVKLFPPNIREIFPGYDVIEKLEEEILIRVIEDLKKE